MSWNSMDEESPDKYTTIIVPLLGENGSTKSKPTDIQDPYAGSTSFFKTCFNGLNALSGVGILSIPYALSSGGWWSLLLFFLIANSTYYTALLIKRCMDLDKSIRSYPDIGYCAFGAKGRSLVSVSMNIELYLVATGFLILEGDNLHSLFPNLEYNIGGMFDIGGKQTFIFVVGLVILPTVWLDNMSILSYVSATGVLASFTLLVLTLWTGIFDGIGFQKKGTPINWKGIPTSISLYAFCYCAHPVFPTLYTSMENPKKFSKVLLACFVISTIGYSSMAILGYLMFGSDLLSQVTLNLPKEKIVSKIAVCTTIVNPLAKYALMVTPVVVALENRFLQSSNERYSSYLKKGLMSALIRTGLLLSTIIVALSIPFFEYLMSFVGAFLSVATSIIFPCVCFLKISGINRRFGFEMLFIWGIVFVGVIVLVVGTFAALHEIIDHLLR